METVITFLNPANQLVPGLDNWVLHVFLVVAATVIFNFFLRLVLKHLEHRAERSLTLWDDALIIGAKRPLLLAGWVIGLSIAAEIVEAVSQNEVFQYTGLVRQIAIILLLMMFLTRFIRTIEDTLLLQKQRNAVETDEIAIRVVARLLRVSVMITGILVILQTMGISISGVLAFGGIGGLAVGFAAKDLLANFFGGVIIYLDRPFTVGDWIRSPDRNIEGVVEDISWRVTVIRTFDKRPLYVPNAVFTTIAVENPSRMSNRRIYQFFGLRYCDVDKIPGILVDVKAMLKAHEDIQQDMIMMVNFDALDASSLNFFIYAFTRTKEWVEFHRVKEDVLLKVLAIIREHDADIAFPTRTINGLDPLLERLDQEAAPQQSA